MVGKTSPPQFPTLNPTAPHSMSEPMSSPSPSAQTEPGPEASENSAQRVDTTHAPNGDACIDTSPGNTDTSHTSDDLMLVDQDDVVSLLPQRKSKTRQQRLLAQGQKPGNRGRFHGPMEAFLERFLEGYANIPKSAKGRRSGDVSTFFQSVLGEFWQEFSWEEVRKQWGTEAAAWDKSVVIQKASGVRTRSLSLVWCLR